MILAGHKHTGEGPSLGNKYCTKLQGSLLNYLNTVISVSTCSVRNVRGDTGTGTLSLLASASSDMTVRIWKLVPTYPLAHRDFELLPPETRM